VRALVAQARGDDDDEFPPNTVKVFTDYDEDPLRVWLDEDVLFIKANSVCIPLAELPGILRRIADAAGLRTPL
jgi:hypothetical protein